MSNIPGISPLTPDLDDVRHSDDTAYVDTSDPDEAPQADEDAAEDRGAGLSPDSARDDRQREAMARQLGAGGPLGCVTDPSR